MDWQQNLMKRRLYVYSLPFTENQKLIQGVPKFVRQNWRDKMGRKDNQLDVGHLGSETHPSSARGKVSW